MENKDLQNLSNEDKEEQKNTDTSPKPEKITRKETFSSIATLVIFFVIITIGFSSGCISCTACGDNNNRLLFYADGTDESGVEYVSCVGPAGCLGFGIDSKCWSTECTYVKMSLSSNEDISGCVTYYNETGCIANSDVKSNGTYSHNTSCLGVVCSGEKYFEKVAESTEAKEQNTVCGVGCGNAVNITPKNYNEEMPRQFKTGCWGNE